MTAEDVLNKTLEILRTDQMNWHKDLKTFTAEASELKPCNFHIAQTIVLQSHKTGVMRVCNKYKVDTDGEDVFGWRYRSEDHEIEILIIND
jgi:hypothetical protein